HTHTSPHSPAHQHLHPFPTRRSSDLATGLGEVNNPPKTGVFAGNTSTMKTLPVLFVGGKSAVVNFAGLAPEFAGLYQVNFTVPRDRKSTRLNSSHLGISYAVFCLKKK